MANELSTDEIGILLAAIDKMGCSLVEVSVGEVRIVVRRGGVAARPRYRPQLNQSVPPRPSPLAPRW